MAFEKQTIRDVELNGKRVLVSVDYNVPGDETGAVTEDMRVEASLPTLKYLLDHKCSLVLISHRGRPKGEPTPSLSLRPVAKILGDMLARPVHFVSDCVSKEAQSAKELLKPGDVLLLENTRFHKEEVANDEDFAKELAAHCDLFVQDAFGNAHRKHASTSAVAIFLPSVAGLLMEKEVSTLTETLDEPAKPFVAALGGAKIADKIDLLDMFLTKAQTILIGGAMANTFFVAAGHEVGKSMYDKDDLDEALRIMHHAKSAGVELILPDQDVVVAKGVEQPDTKHTVNIAEIEDNEMILDIGPKSLEKFEESLKGAETVFWNGTLGITEEDAFAEGSRKFAEAVAYTGATTVVGGGDTAGFIDKLGMSAGFSHVSTGGGASLELISGHTLPALAALQDKSARTGALTKA